jgi:hypothetical protein
MYPQRQDHGGWLQTLIEQLIPYSYRDPKPAYLGAGLFGNCDLHRTAKARRVPTREVRIGYVLAASKALPLPDQQATDRVFSSAAAKSSGVNDAVGG